MKNVRAIFDMSHQLAKSAEMVESFIMGIQNIEEAEGFTESYEAMLYDEIEHLQIITLEMTKAITDADPLNEDEGSVFAAGELTSEKEAPASDDEMEG